MFLSTAIPKPSVHFLPAMSCKTIIGSSFTNSLLLSPLKHTCIYKHPTCFAFSRESKLQPNHDHNLQPQARSRNKKTKIIKKEVEDPDSICKSNSETGFDYNPNVESKHKARIQNNKTKVVQKKVEDPDSLFPPIIPKKPRRGRKSEAAAVEDFVRESLERTFASIKQQNPEIFKDKKSPMKDRVDDEIDSDGSDEDEDDVISEKEMVVEEENPNWPLDADVGWGIRASEYFDQHPIKNVVGEDGVEIDWEGEIDDNWVKEINCLEWESIAFHPSPLIVLVFERYNRATDNWKVLKELEKAAKVYWSAKDRLPPRTVKIDINIEKDLAYALKVKECPQILFLRGNRILYRETKTRTADELVHMIAHFYYNAKQPSWISEEI